MRIEDKSESDYKKVNFNYQIKSSKNIVESNSDSQNTIYEKSKKFLRKQKVVSRVNGQSERSPYFNSIDYKVLEA